MNQQPRSPLLVRVPSLTDHEGAPSAGLLTSAQWRTAQPAGTPSLGKRGTKAGSAAERESEQARRGRRRIDMRGMLVAGRTVGKIRSRGMGGI